jgi:4'-phosphopantetheinyl transferase
MARLSWLQPARQPVLGAGEVHVWRCRLDTAAVAAERLAARLDEEERRRAERFASGEGRRRFVTARGVLRELIGGYLGRDPGAVRFEIGALGKPALAGPSSPGALQFNLSHAGDLVVLAFARGGEVGVDVERVRASARWREIAARHFALAETAVLEALPAHRRLIAFFLAWSGKEAVTKARGEGLFGVLAAPLLPLPLDDAPVSVTVPGDAAGRRWRLRRLRPGRGYVGALACAPQLESLRRLTWTPRLGPSGAGRRGGGA